MKIDFESLVGERASLYYNNKLNEFQLGSVTFEVLEDEDDGYRSYLKEIRVVNTESIKDQLLDIITIIEAQDKNMTGYELKGDDGFVWVEFGTNNSDDYYPSFIFNKNAKLEEPSTVEIAETEINKIKELIK